MNGGEDWNVANVGLVGGEFGSAMIATPLCGSGMNQSPINIAEALTVYNSSLTPLDVSYGMTTGFTMAVTSA